MFFRPLAETKFINDANLVSYWKLEDLTDSKGGNTLTNINSATFVAGKYGNGVNLAKASSQLLTTTTTPVTGTGEKTISCWVKPASFSAFGNVAVAIGGQSTANQILLGFQSSGKASAWLSGGGGLAQSSATSSTGNWYHLVGVFKTSGFLLYVDGALVATGSSNSMNVSGTNGNFFGCYQNYDSNWGFDGVIDDVAVFSDALSASEVNELYQGITLGEYLGAGSGTTKLLLRLNDNFTDMSGNNNVVSATSGVTFVDGVLGKCANLNNSYSTSRNNYLSATPISYSSNSFTIGFKIKITEQPNSNTQQCLFNYQQSSAYSSTLDYRDEGGTKKWNYNSGGNETKFSFTETLNTWVNYTFVKDGGTAYIYREGNLLFTSNIISNGGLNLFLIGGFVSADVRGMCGYIDNVFSESRALSQQEIKKRISYSKGRYAII